MAILFYSICEWILKRHSIVKVTLLYTHYQAYDDIKKQFQECQVHLFYLIAIFHEGYAPQDS